MKKNALRILSFSVLILLIVGCNIQQADEPPAPLELERVIMPATRLRVVADPPTSQPSSSEANADVLFVIATETAVNLWTFNVKVTHPDSGWEDYADGWDV
ncbi:MAG: hypothetical protein GY805_00100, partial [Chloroflexi bacterium]|nr:hypothetical protein [Chloroflexota bacterium]